MWFPHVQGLGQVLRRRSHGRHGSFRVRLLVVLATCSLVAAGVGGAYAYRAYEAYAEAQRAKKRGLAAYERGEPQAAIRQFRRYLGKPPKDVAILEKLADARAAVPVPGRRHIKTAVRVLHRVLELAPQREKARRRLLKLYEKIEPGQKALEAARAALDADPDDPLALRVQAAALENLERFEEALPVAKHYNRVAPKDLDGHRRTMRILEALGRPPTERVQRAKRLLQKHPGAPRFQLLRAMTHLTVGERSAAKKWAKKAAKQPSPDDDFVRSLLETLDRLRLFETALESLRTAVAEGKSPELRCRLLRRLALLGRDGELLDRIGTTPRPEDPEQEGVGDEIAAEIRGLKALSLLRTGRRDRAMEIVGRLSDGRGAVADAWAAAIRRISGASVEPARLAKAVRRGVAAEPEQPVLFYALGIAEADRGEHTRATAAWRRAAEIAPVWGLPLHRAAAAAMREGNTDTAVQLAGRALARPSSSNAAVLLFAEALYADLENRPPEARRRLRKLVGMIQEVSPGEPRTLPIHVALLARAGEKDAARKAVRRAVERKPPHDARTLLRLSNVSRSADLGLSDACLARCKAAHGLSAPLALARAERLGKTHGPQRAVEYLESSEDEVIDEDASSSARLDWRMTKARFLERTDPSRAIERWKRIARDHPEDRRVQQEILDRPLTWENKGFCKKTIDRLEKISEDGSSTWRIARARWLLRYRETRDAAAKAATLLRPVVEVSPDATRPRLLLGRALQRMDDPTAALQQLTTVAKRRPRALDVRLRIAELALAAGRRTRAQRAIDTVVSSDAATAAQRRRAAALSLRLGEPRRAASVLRSLPDAKAGLLLARCYRRLGKREKAIAIGRKAVEGETPRATAVAFLANTLAKSGRREEARKVLSRLSETDASPARRHRIRAAFLARHGDGSRALAALRSATEAAPEDPANWRARLAHLVRQGRTERLQPTLDAAKKRLPSSAPIGRLHENAALLEAAASTPAWRRLGVALVERPDVRQAVAEVLRLLRDGGVGGKDTGAKERLKTLADEHRAVRPLQQVIAEHFLAEGATDAAATLAKRAMERFPTSAALARLAAHAFGQKGAWWDALHAAEAWRRRTDGSALPADLFLAKARRRVDEASRALERTAPYLDRDLRERDRLRVYFSHARSLLAAGKPKKAYTLLKPHLDEGPPWRVQWERVVQNALEERPRRVRWLETVTAAIPEDPSWRASLAVAQAWSTLAERSGKASEWQQAASVARRVDPSENMPADALFHFGLVLQRADRPEPAIRFYRRALRKDADHAQAHNNLAMALVRHAPEKGTEAWKHARKAADLQPKPPMFDTLALVQSKLGNHAAAKRAVGRAIEGEPENPKWRIRRAEILARNGAHARASRVLGRVASRDGGDLPTPLRRRVRTLRRELSGEEAQP